MKEAPKTIDKYLAAIDEAKRDAGLEKANSDRSAGCRGAHQLWSARLSAESNCLLETLAPPGSTVRFTCSMTPPLTPLTVICQGMM